MTAASSSRELQRQAMRGGAIVALGGVANQAITAFGGVLLARGLPPEVFGLYGVLSYVITFWAFFGDIGFGPAIVQKREEPSLPLLRSAFTAGVVALGLILVAITGSLPFVHRWYHLPAGAGWALVALAGALSLSFLRGMPTLLLQREMKFRTIVQTDLAETGTFMAVAVALAWLGAGIWSFVGGVWVSRVVGVLLVWRARPWPIGFAWDRAAVREALPMAAPLRLRDVFSLARSAMNPVVVGSLAGLPAVGYITWGEGLAGLAGFAAGVVNRVSLPTFSRLQDDPEAVRQTLRESVRIGCGWYYPAAALLVGLAPAIVHWVYTDRWGPALPALYLFILGGALTAPTLAYDNLFIALGRPQWVLRFEIAFLILNLGLGIPLIVRYGFLGYPLTKLAISAAVVGVDLWLGYRLTGVLPLREAGQPMIIGAAVWIISSVAASHLVRGMWSLAGVGGTMALAAAAALFFWDRERWRSRWALLRGQPV